jgi:hypothetical protein
MTTETNQMIGEVALAMVERRIDLIAGARRIVELRHSSIGLPDELFSPIVGFESETADWVAPEQRAKFAKAYLVRIDAQITEYCNQASSGVLDACVRLLDAVRDQQKDR